MSNTHRWMFVGEIPILCEMRRLTKQFQIWFWLDSKPVLEAVGIKKLEENVEEKIRGYVS